MIYQQLKEANVAALKNHDANARAILSVLLNKIKLVEIEKRTENADLTDADVVAVLQKTLKELDEEKQAFERAGRTENVQALNAQIAFVSAYLPKMMTDEEIKAEILALSDKSVPSVMKHFKANFAGKCDMRRVQEVLKSL
ncbi:MAG TPA: GatB/YqeY domain-containing protein [Candidatus Fimimonas merdipullorum]|uniref:GatB/YqeY domain-containing protein n=1 Tax=Candidatus Fimimonas merdipullorum TaxID=2840822 RepID=A0A9D1MX96_9BACT|nr:GatB/YqeY domain-containing protein [Candidatus Fimimonas merdipullorum]